MFEKIFCKHFFSVIGLFGGKKKSRVKFLDGVEKPGKSLVVENFSYTAIISDIFRNAAL